MPKDLKVTVRAFTCGHDYAIAHAVEGETAEERRERIKQVSNDEPGVIVFAVLCDDCMALRDESEAKNVYHAIMGAPS